jgi:hypothetical protein
MTSSGRVANLGIGAPTVPHLGSEHLKESWKGFAVLRHFLHALYHHFLSIFCTVTVTSQSVFCRVIFWNQYVIKIRISIEKRDQTIKTWPCTWRDGAILCLRPSYVQEQWKPRAHWKSCADPIWLVGKRPTHCSRRSLC